MWRVLAPGERELWQAVVGGVDAFDAGDRDAFNAAVRRLMRCVPSWRRIVLTHTARLLREEIEGTCAAVEPTLRSCLAGRAQGWTVIGDRLPLTRAAGPDAAAAEPAGTEHRLLLVACLCVCAQVRVAAFVDTALVLSRAALPARGYVVPRTRPGW